MVGALVPVLKHDHVVSSFVDCNLEVCSSASCAKFSSAIRSRALSRSFTISSASNSVSYLTLSSRVQDEI